MQFMDHLYSLYDALVSINVPSEKARAVVDAMERDMMDKLATKADLQHMRELLTKDMQIQLAALNHQMTIRLGSMIAGAIVLLGAVQSLI
jgi:hypothetical protein